MHVHRFYPAANSRAFSFSCTSRHEWSENEPGVWLQDVGLQGHLEQGWLRLCFEKIGRLVERIQLSTGNVLTRLPNRRISAYQREDY